MPRSKSSLQREEARFLSAYDPNQYPRPSVAVDVVLLTVDDGQLKTLLVRRNEHPELGKWALPGGFVRMEESLDAAASRVLADKAGVTRIFLEQLYSFGEPDRDPRMRVIAVAYFALVEASRLVSAVRGRDGVVLATLRVPWKGERGGPVEARDAAGDLLPLAFDHAQILGTAVKRLRGKLNYVPIGFELLPPQFTLRQLQEIYDTILGRSHNKDSFRRRMLASGFIVATGRREESVGHRPAELYRFKRRGKS